jgi:hypothetical protein
MLLKGIRGESKILALAFFIGQSSGHAAAPTSHSLAQALVSQANALKNSAALAKAFSRAGSE